MSFSSEKHRMSKSFRTAFSHETSYSFVEPQEDIDEISEKYPIWGVIRCFSSSAQSGFFQSVISVKILSLNAERMKKNLVVITRDPGDFFCQRLNISHAPDMEHLEELPIERSLREQKTLQQESKSIRVRSFSREHQRKQNEFLL